MSRVEGKVAFITGAGQGQGRSHALRLAEEGAHIVATDVCAPYPADVKYQAATVELLEETRLLVEKAGGRCVTAVADVRDRAALRGAVDAGMAEFGRIDVVCANAGVITMHDSSFEITDESYDLIVDVNLKGVFNTVMATAQAMIDGRRGGSMILTSSCAGIRGGPNYTHYSGAKHGVVGLMRAFANEFGPKGIRVNTIHPTGVATPGMGSGAGAYELMLRNEFMAMQARNVLPDLDTDFSSSYVPLGAFKEIEISNAVLFLASDESRYITGATIPIDAGCTNKP
jgi:SDR family mycofactocin-dependent oxidoreductase